MYTIDRIRARRIGEPEIARHKTAVRWPSDLLPIPSQLRYRLPLSLDRRIPTQRHAPHQSASADSRSATSFQLVVGGGAERTQFQPASAGLVDRGFNPLFQDDLRPVIPDASADRC
jgi:hypothetical protein